MGLSESWASSSSAHETGSVRPIKSGLSSHILSLSPYTSQLSRCRGILRSLLFWMYWLLVNLTWKNLSMLRYRGHHCCSKLTKLPIYQHHWNGVTLNIESGVPYSLLWHNRCRWHFLGLISNNAAVPHPPHTPPPPQKNHLLFVI